MQSFTLNRYPAKLSLTALICLTGTVEGAVASLVFERNMGVWLIGLDSKLLAVVYAVGSSLFRPLLCHTHTHIYIYEEHRFDVIENSGLIARLILGPP